MSLMAAMVLLTFIGANLQALFWQSSHWLVSTVLPAVVVDLTNEEREQSALPALSRSTVLDNAAKLKAEHMAKNEYFAHYSPTGVSPWHWFDEVGYVYAHAGENLAIHFTDSAEVVEAWMNSPTHRQNIVGSQYTEIGVGTAKGTYEGYDTVYVVQLFGTPAIPPAAVPVALVATGRSVPVEVVEEVPVKIASAEVAETTQPDPVVAAVTPTASEVATAPTSLVAETVEVAKKPEVLISDVVDIPVIVDSETEVVMLESVPIATSSGLAIAQVTTPHPTHAGATLPAIATQPNVLLQWVYFCLGVVVLLLLSTSIVLEMHRFRVTQVMYGILLLCGMGVLWYTHLLLTSGAVIT